MANSRQSERISVWSPSTSFNSRAKSAAQHRSGKEWEERRAGEERLPVARALVVAAVTAVVGRRWAAPGRRGVVAVGRVGLFVAARGRWTVAVVAVVPAWRIVLGRAARGPRAWRVAAAAAVVVAWRRRAVIPAAGAVSARRGRATATIVVVRRRTIAAATRRGAGAPAAVATAVGGRGLWLFLGGRQRLGNFAKDRSRYISHAMDGSAFVLLPVKLFDRLFQIRRGLEFHKAESRVSKSGSIRLASLLTLGHHARERSQSRRHPRQSAGQSLSNPIEPW